MNPSPPIPVEVAMAFSAESVTFGEIDQFSVIKPEFIAVFGIVAIKAPAHAFRMVHDDLRMFVLELPFLTVDLHGGMALAAGENAFGKGRRGNGEFLIRSLDWSGQEKPC